MNKKIILIILMITASLFSCSKDVKTDLSPGQHVMKASENMSKEGATDISARIDFDLDFETMKDEFADGELTSIDFPEELVELINNASIDMNYKIKANHEEASFDYQLDYAINYNESPLLQMMMIMNEESMGMGFTNFYDKIFAIDFPEMVSKLASMESMEDLSDLDFEKYIDILMKSDNENLDKLKESEAYKEILVKYLDKALSEGVNEEISYTKNDEVVTEHVMTYSLTYDIVEILELFLDLMNEAEGDDNLKACVETILEELLDTFIDSKDYELLGYSLEETEMLKSQLFDDFDGNWQAFFKGFKEEFTDFDSMMDDQSLLEVNRIYSNLDFKLSINKDEMLSYMAASIDYDGLKYDMTYVVNNTGDNVVIDDYSDDTINILDFIDFENPDQIANQEELAKIIKEFLLGAIDELVEGEAYIELFKDLEELEDSLGINVSDMTTSLGMAKLMLSNLSEEEIIEYLNQASSLFGLSGYEDDFDYEDDYYSDRELAVLDNVALIVDSEKVDSFADKAVSDAIDQSYLEISSQRIVSSAENAFDDIQSAIDGGADIVFTLGNTLTPALDNIAALHPQVQFIPLDSYPNYYDVNMTYIDYYNEEIAYLAGYVLSLMSQTNTIGFIGATDELYYQNFGVSFRDGALAANPEMVVELVYTGSSDDIAGGLLAVNDLHDMNVDKIYTVAGTSSRGVVDACEEYGIQVISHNDMYGESNETLIGITLVDYYMIANQLMEDYSYGITSDYEAYGVAETIMFLSAFNIPQDVMDIYWELASQIEDSTLFIPTYYGE